MGDEKKQSERLPDRRVELRADIAKLSARIEAMAAQALLVEKGQTDVRQKFDENGNLLGREETLKFQPSAAVGYWREVREEETRLDTLRRELRDLEAAGSGEALHVYIHFNGPKG